MKTALYSHKLAVKSCALLFTTLFLNATPALAYQQDQGKQSETRYIDRSKGERNIAVPLTQPESKQIQLANHPAGSPLLWRIEHSNNSSDIRSSYIFGTIHIDDERVMEIPDSLLRRLVAADTLMLELELNEDGSVDMLRKMLFTDGRNLTQVIGEENFMDVKDALLESGNRLPQDVLTLLKPWAAMLLLIKPENKSGTFLDKKLARLAGNTGVRVQGLETVNEQLSVFDNIEIGDQIRLLESAMDTLNEKDQAYQQILEAYLSGDLEELVKVSKSQQPRDPHLAELIETKLITERNQRMFNRMQQGVQNGNTFIAVGALHLPGQQGLLEKLRNAGYRLTRIGPDD